MNIFFKKSIFYHALSLLLLNHWIDPICLANNQARPQKIENYLEWKLHKTIETEWETDHNYFQNYLKKNQDLQFQLDSFFYGLTHQPSEVSLKLFDKQSPFISNDFINFLVKKSESNQLNKHVLFYMLTRLNSPSYFRSNDYAKMNSFYENYARKVENLPNSDQMSFEDIFEFNNFFDINLYTYQECLNIKDDPCLKQIENNIIKLSKTKYANLSSSKLYWFIVSSKNPNFLLENIRLDPNLLINNDTSNFENLFYTEILSDKDSLFEIAPIINLYRKIDHENVIKLRQQFLKNLSSTINLSLSSGKLLKNKSLVFNEITELRNSLAQFLDDFKSYFLPSNLGKKSLSELLKPLPSERNSIASQSPHIEYQNLMERFTNIYPKASLEDRRELSYKLKRYLLELLKLHSTEVLKSSIQEAQSYLQSSYKVLSSFESKRKMFSHKIQHHEINEENMSKVLAWTQKYITLLSNIDRRFSKQIDAKVNQISLEIEAIYQVEKEINEQSVLFSFIESNKEELEKYLQALVDFKSTINLDKERNLENSMENKERQKNIEETVLSKIYEYEKE